MPAGAAALIRNSAIAPEQRRRVEARAARQILESARELLRSKAREKKEEANAMLAAIQVRAQGAGVAASCRPGGVLLEPCTARFPSCTVMVLQGCLSAICITLRRWFGTFLPAAW